MNRVFVSLGSNIDPERYLPEAVRRLAASCRLLAASPVYETQPVGSTGQPNFLNAAVLVETEESATRFKSYVLEVIERELGRVRTEDKYAARTIDLDISLFNEDVFDLEGRHIPDPEILQHPHIARPLADLAPDYRHPETGQTLCQIAGALPEDGLMLRSDLVL